MTDAHSNLSDKITHVSLDFSIQMQNCEYDYYGVAGRGQFHIVLPLVAADLVHAAKIIPGLVEEAKADFVVQLARRKAEVAKKELEEKAALALEKETQADAEN